MAKKKSIKEKILSGRTIGERVRACLLELKGYQQKKILSEIILQFLDNNGTFYNTNAGQFYFVDETKELIKVSYEGKTFSHTQDFANFLNDEPELNSTLPVFTFIFQDIVQKINRQKYIEVHKNFYYDSEKYILYIYNNDGRTLKVTDKKRQVINNGEDEIFFINTGAEKLDLNVIKEHNPKENLLDTLLIDKINFQKNNLTVNEQKGLFKTWIMSILFEDIQPTKPLIVFQGEAGSGKTDSLKAVGKILFGNVFSEKPIQRDIRDFYSSIVNNYYYQIDNLDANKPEWFEDTIASITTGSSLEMRALYKNVTDAPVLISPKIFISISTMNASFTRQDIASRTVLFTVQKLTRYDNGFIQKLIQHRNEIMREIIEYAQLIIKELKTNKKSVSTELRLADFANFIMKTKNIFGVDPTIIDKINSTQNTFALQNDPITDIIRTAIQKDENNLRDRTATELYKIFKDIAHNDLGTRFLYGSPRSLSIQLKQKEKNIKEFFDYSTTVKDGYTMHDIKKKTHTLEFDKNLEQY